MPDLVNNSSLESLKQLFESSFKQPVLELSEIGSHASDRSIFTIKSSDDFVVGVACRDLEGNAAFVRLARHFASKQLPVPQILAEDLENGVYIQEYLGTQTLFDVLDSERSEQDPFPEQVEALFSAALIELPKFQVRGREGLDFSQCYPREAHDQEAMLADMHYFRESFLRISGVVCNEVLLEKEFLALASFLEKSPNDFFLYRDFQSRNIMVQEGSLKFIDFQNGCRGPLQYDVASLLYQSKAAIPDKNREKLLLTYLDALAEEVKIDATLFRESFHSFVLLRRMQTLGTYGKFGLTMGKEYFLKSIPYAVRNFRDLLDSSSIPNSLPELKKVASELASKFGEEK